MGLKNDIKKLTQKIEKLNQVLNSETLYKAQKYDETISLLNNIKIEAKTLKKINENGDLELIIKYSIPDVVLSFDANKKTFEWKNNFFYSINKLDLLDQESYNNIVKAMQEIEKQTFFKKR